MRISAHIWREYVNCTQKGPGLPLNPEPDHVIPPWSPSATSSMQPGCIYAVYKKRKRLQPNDYSGLDTQEKPTCSYYLITMQVKDGGGWVGFLVSQVMAVLSAEFKACWTFSRSHPQDFSFGVPPTVNQTIFMTFKKFWSPRMLQRKAKQSNTTHTNTFCLAWSFHT